MAEEKKYKYRTGNRSFDVRAPIKKVEIEDESPSYVTIYASPLRTRKEAKVSNWSVYHDTWEDAHEYILARTTEKLNREQQCLDAVRAELGRYAKMTEPENS